MTVLEYTPAAESDLPLLLALNKALIDEYEDTAAIDYPRVIGWVQRNLAAHLSDIRRVRMDGRLAGFFCLCNGELDSLFVLPEYQRKGIGSRIIRHCQSLSPSLFLYVFRKNHGAIALYRRMGFQITGEAGTTRYIMTWNP